MKHTVELSEDEVLIAVKEYLQRKGLEVENLRIVMKPERSVDNSLGWQIASVESDPRPFGDH